MSPRHLPHDAAQQVQQELARRHVLDWAILNNPTYERLRHAVLLGEHLEALERGDINRLIVQMPPQHVKSTTCAQAFPSWYLGRNPEKHIVLASYGADLAHSHSRKARRWLSDNGKRVFGVELQQDSQAVSAWETAQGGGMVSVGFTGPASGRPATGGVIIDDPYRDEQEAASPLIRQRVIDRWNHVLRVRMHPGAFALLDLTRWEHDDLAGYFLEQGGWTLLDLPALAKEDDELGREPGEGLWRETTWYEDVREEIGSRAFNALYQQNPTPDSGEVFDIRWIKYWDTLPETFDLMAQSWDLTFDDKATSDFVVGQVWGVKGLDRYLIHQVRGRWDVVATMRQIRMLSDAYPLATGKYIEKAANGHAVIRLLRNEIEGIVAVIPKGSKTQRAHAVTPLFESGHVYYPNPDNVPWVADHIAEMAQFPRGKHDDQVDPMTQALSRMPASAPSYPTREDEIEPDMVSGKHANLRSEGF